MTKSEARMTNERHLAKDLLITALLLAATALIVWWVIVKVLIPGPWAGFMPWAPAWFMLGGSAVAIGVPAFWILRLIFAAIFKSIRAYVKAHRFPRILWVLAIIAFLLVESVPGSRVKINALKVVAKNDLTQIVDGLRNYKTEYGDFPRGTNAEIAAKLRGDNPRNIQFMDIVSNPHGEFIDPWGMPYQIGVSSTGTPWAYSFGKNKIDEYGNGDDVKSW